MNQPLVSVIVLAYNSVRHLPALFVSLAHQTHTQLEIIVVDNASSDGTVAWLQQQTIIPIQLKANPTNQWFAQGNNEAIALCHGDYILFCNDDLELEPHCIERLVAAAQSHPQAGIIGGKLIRPVQPGEITPRIDSAGLEQRWTGQVINRGENDQDQGQYDIPMTVFGITGAAHLVTRPALERLCWHGEYFDNQFVAYKEDVDVSWRARRLGYSSWYQPDAIATHHRTVRANGLAQRHLQSSLIRAMSYRNHWWTLIKNLTWYDIPWLLSFILPYELAKLTYLVLREPKTLQQIPTMLRALPLMWSKRQL